MEYLQKVDFLASALHPRPPFHFYWTRQRTTIDQFDTAINLSDHVVILTVLEII